MNKRPLIAGFTLLEVLLSVSILAAITVVTWMCFGTVTLAWRKGQAMADRLHHGDYIIEQVMMGLRSAYFPEGGRNRGIYGMWNEDGGDGEQAEDWVSWVKLGGALVGNDSPFAGSPHRVRLMVRDRDDGTRGLDVQAWRLHGQPDDFDPETVEAIQLPGAIRGFNCRMAYELKDGVIDWLDVWEQTNRLPTVVEITFTLEPEDEGDTPLTVKRLVGIPVGVLSWQ